MATMPGVYSLWYKPRNNIIRQTQIEGKYHIAVEDDLFNVVFKSKDKEYSLTDEQKESVLNDYFKDSRG